MYLLKGGRRVVAKRASTTTVLSDCMISGKAHYCINTPRGMCMYAQRGNYYNSAGIERETIHHNMWLYQVFIAHCINTTQGMYTRAQRGRAAAKGRSTTICGCIRYCSVYQHYTGHVHACTRGNTTTKKAESTDYLYKKNTVLSGCIRYCSLFQHSTGHVYACTGGKDCRKREHLQPGCCISVYPHSTGHVSAQRGNYYQKGEDLLMIPIILYSVRPYYNIWLLSLQNILTLYTGLHVDVQSAKPILRSTYIYIYILFLEGARQNACTGPSKPPIGWTLRTTLIGALPTVRRAMP